jgi:hypothetical protein
MKNKKIILVILFLQICLNNLIYSQNKSDYNIFSKICDEMIVLNQNYFLKIILNKKFQLVIDVSSMEYDIDTLKTKDLDKLAIHKDIDKGKLISILLQDTIPIIPLGKSIQIIDTIGFFKTDYSYSNSEFTFKIVNRNNYIPLTECNNFIKLSYIKRIDNELILSFITNKEENHCLNFYFKIIDNKVILNKYKSLWRP